MCVTVEYCGGPESVDRFFDVQEWGFRDARLEERVQMTEKDIADWTDAIEKEE